VRAPGWLNSFPEKRTSVCNSVAMAPTYFLQSHTKMTNAPPPNQSRASGVPPDRRMVTFQTPNSFWSIFSHTYAWSYFEYHFNIINIGFRSEAVTMIYTSAFLSKILNCQNSITAQPIWLSQLPNRAGWLTTSNQLSRSPDTQKIPDTLPFFGFCQF
jgi:hypothetical protein